MNRIQMPIFELGSIRITREGRTALKIGKFQFHRGTIYGIAGPIGSGKTTLLETLAGRLNPSEGTVLYESERYAKTWLGKTKVPPEILFLGNQINDFGGSVRDLIQKNLPDRLDYVQRQYYSRPPFSSDWEMSVQSLSKGQSYRMNIIVAIESDPKVLIIDDYGIRFDAQMKREFDRRLTYSARSRGTTVILSHVDMANLRNVASIIVSLDNGHISKVRSLKKHAPVSPK